MGLWVPITVAAAFLQFVRTALQKHLKGKLSTNGAAFTRFVYGVPLAILYVYVLHHAFGHPWPQPHLEFAINVGVGSVSQIMATSLLLLAFNYKNFAVGVTYSKTEAIQTGIFGLVILGETVSLAGVLSLAVGTVGVMMISIGQSKSAWRSFLTGWMEKAALIGIASGGLFGVSAVAFRGASLSLDGPNFAMQAGFTLACSITLQTLLMGGYLYWREREQLRKVVQTWRISSLVGITGVIGSIGWFTAFTIQIAAYVRTLAQIELVFTFVASYFLFKERASRPEIIGILLVVASIVVLLNAH
ncbi:MAG: DMT family transporter [Alphaproteobacteria bacterium]|nr:DMT family transporter [Alphaproteobacteria bacterium]